MCKIEPSIDILPRSITLNAPGKPAITMSLDALSSESFIINVCGGKKCNVFPCKSLELDSWLSEYLGFPCRLVRVCDVGESLSNSAALLLLNSSSLSALGLNSADRFRPNLLLSGSRSFSERDWRMLSSAGFCIEIGSPCVRCSMIDVDPLTGDRSRMLGHLRSSVGSLEFGVYGRVLRGASICVGCRLHVGGFVGCGPASRGES
jgi:uncharacterized protein YcbX